VLVGQNTKRLSNIPVNLRVNSRSPSPAPSRFRAPRVASLEPYMQKQSPRVLPVAQPPMTRKMEVQMARQKKRVWIPGGAGESKNKANRVMLSRRFYY